MNYIQLTEPASKPVANNPPSTWQQDGNKQKKEKSLRFQGIGTAILQGGAPKRNRTSDLRFRKPTLYPADIMLPCHNS